MSSISGSSVPPSGVPIDSESGKPEPQTRNRSSGITSKEPITAGSMVGSVVASDSSPISTPHSVPPATRHQSEAAEKWADFTKILAKAIRGFIDSAQQFPSIVKAKLIGVEGLKDSTKLLTPEKVNKLLSTKNGFQALRTLLNGCKFSEPLQYCVFADLYVKLLNKSPITELDIQKFDGLQHDTLDAASVITYTGKPVLDQDSKNKLNSELSALREQLKENLDSGKILDSETLKGMQALMSKLFTQGCLHEINIADNDVNQLKQALTTPGDHTAIIDECRAQVTERLLIDNLKRNLAPEHFKALSIQEQATLLSVLEEKPKKAP